MEPLGLRLAVALIEVLSFFIRLFSLSIRLFANMFAGHVLLHVIATVIYNSFVARQFYCFVHYTILLFSFIWA
jgi:F0F1-type ATP synthase membrane subunit a